MAQTRSNLMHYVWHLLETFKPEGLEQHVFPDRDEIHFIKDGVFMTFWADGDGNEAEANIVFKKKNLYVRGPYSDILKALESKLEEANEKDNV